MAQFDQPTPTAYYDSPNMCRHSGGNDWAPTQVVNGAGDAPVAGRIPRRSDGSECTQLPCGGVLDYGSNACHPRMPRRPGCSVPGYPPDAHYAIGRHWLIDPAEAVGSANDRLPTGHYDNIRVPVNVSASSSIPRSISQGWTPKRRRLHYGDSRHQRRRTGGLVIGDGADARFCPRRDLNMGNNGAPSRSILATRPIIRSQPPVAA